METNSLKIQESSSQINQFQIADKGTIIPYYYSLLGPHLQYFKLRILFTYYGLMQYNGNLVLH